MRESSTSQRTASATATGHGFDELGTPISVQQRAMRHGDIRVTMNVYGDPVSDALREATSKVAERATSQLLTKSVS